MSPESDAPVEEELASEPDPEPIIFSASAKAKAGSKTHRKEEPRHITTTAFVRLGGDGLPEEYQGVEAAVIDAPSVHCGGCAQNAQPHRHQPAGTVFQVRTRDDRSQILQVTAEDFLHVAYDGRVGLNAAG